MKTKITVYKDKAEKEAYIEPLNKRSHRIQPLKDIPKTWEKIGVYSHSLENAYNQSLISIYKAKGGSLRFSLYRDGCFYEYCGKINFIN